MEKTADSLSSWHLARHGSILYSSPINSSAGTSELTERKDCGLFAKFTNPRNENRMAIVIAGIRGVGTWGVSDFLRKSTAPRLRRPRWPQGYRLKPPFAFVVGSTLRDYDVIEPSAFDFTHLRSPPP